MEPPEELRAEQRWSSIPQQSAQIGYWPKHLDEKLLVLVTHATASGDRFPVGVNWLDISRSIGYSPAECVKRYAFLHNFRESHGIPLAQHRSDVQHSRSVEHEQDEDRASRADSDSNSLASDESQDDGHEEKPSDDSQVPFSGLSSSDELGSPNSRAFLEYGSPLASPRLDSLNNSGEFGVGSPRSPPPFAPGSPMPFALRQPGRQEGGGATASSPFRWESIAKETYASPVLKQPPHILLQQQQLRSSFGIATEPDRAGGQSAAAAEGVQSPRIVHGTHNHSKFTDPNFAADIVNHAFKGLQLDGPPSNGASPRLIRTISNSEYPFLKEEDSKSVRRVPTVAEGDASDTALAGQLLSRTPPMSAKRLAPGAVASPRAMLASFQGDNPFSASLTQSALEEAFLDMAGSRLDASSVLFASRYADAQSRIRTDAAPAPDRETRQARARPWGHSPQKK